MSEKYAGAHTVAEWLNVGVKTIAVFRQRAKQRQDSGWKPFPEPDVEITTRSGVIPGWSPSRKWEIIRWDENRRSQN